jgi:cell division septum initiation protein DivIVA
VNLPQSSIIDKIADHRDELLNENRKLNQHIKRLEEALHRIANTDYRGNRSTESQIAFEALKEAKL